MYLVIEGERKKSTWILPVEQLLTSSKVVTGYAPLQEASKNPIKRPLKTHRTQAAAVTQRDACLIIPLEKKCVLLFCVWVVWETGSRKTETEDEEDKNMVKMSFVYTFNGKNR